MSGAGASDTAGAVTPARAAHLTPGRVGLLLAALAVLLVLPLVLPPFETLQVSYGLIFGIAALGFNLLLGYTGLLSFGHSAFFGTGAYAAAFLLLALVLVLNWAVDRIARGNERLGWIR